MKEYALQHSQPHVSLHRHSEDTLAAIIIILTITRLYAEYLKKKKSNFEWFLLLYFVMRKYFKVQKY